MHEMGDFDRKIIHEYTPYRTAREAVYSEDSTVYSLERALDRIILFPGRIYSGS